MITQKECRVRVESLLGLLPDDLWQELEEEAYIEDALIAENGFKALMEAARQKIMMRALGVDNSPTPEMEPRLGGQKFETGISRRRAISELLAIEARHDPSVNTFRQDVLDGKLLAPEEVELWINQEAEKDGPAAKWITIPLPEGHSLDQDKGDLVITPPLTVSRQSPPYSLSMEFLDYAVHGQKWAHRVPIRHDGVLGRLHGLSRRLARRYTWMEAQATVFVLTDLVPLIPTLRVRVAPSYHYSVLARITLTVDPSLSPEEVAEAYRQARNKVVPRHRDMSEKHMHLALFLAECPEGETWATRMEHWNKEHPQWAYTERTNFARDCTHAQRRLLGDTAA